MESELLINITTQSVIISTVGILGFIIGSLIYSRDVRRADTLSFFLLSWVFCIWALFLGIFESIESGELSFLILKILYLLTALLPVAVLFFVSTLSQDGKIIFSKIKLLVSTAPFFILTILFLTLPNLLFNSIKNDAINIRTILSDSWFLVIVLYVFLYLLVSIILLHRKYKQSAGIFKSEVKYILFSISVTSFFVLFTGIVLPFFDFYGFFWFSVIFIFIFLCSVGYSILKYNFWNLKLASTDLFTSLISLMLLFELFLSISVVDFIIKTIILLLVLFAGLFLVKNVREEIENREEAERLVRDLADINDNLHLLNKQKTEFVTTSAHHLRDPLTVINGYTSMILDGSFGGVNKKTREAVNRILESSKRLVVIVEDFMNISKIESGNMNFEFSNVDISKMIKEIVDEMYISAKERGLKLELNIDNNNFISKVDSGKLRQVVLNLIDNAIKYTPNGYVNISLSKENNGKILIKLSDTGIGMSKETLKKIFHKFSRADRASKFHTGGSGLGLYIARQMLKKHEGRIWARSEGVGKGSTFYVELNA